MSGFIIKKVDPSTVQWKTQGRYEEIIKRVGNLKIGECLFIENFAQLGRKASASYIAQSVYKRVKGVYKIRVRVIGDGVYYHKTAK